MRLSAAGTAVPDQRERVQHRASPGLQMEVVKAAQHALAMRHGRRLVPIATRPLAGHRIHPRPGSLLEPAPPPPGYRQCGLSGLTAVCSQWQKSRASTRVAWSQPTPSAHKNRTHRSRPVPYERCVVAAARKPPTRPTRWASPRTVETSPIRRWRGSEALDDQYTPSENSHTAIGKARIPDGPEIRSHIANNTATSDASVACHK
jgi:hypothetical protein